MVDAAAKPSSELAAWADRSVHRSWLITQGQRLLEHYRGAQVAGGFGTLNDSGQLTGSSAVTIVTARMVHCYSVAALMGVPGAGLLADHGLTSLLDGALRDKAHDGWFESEVDADGSRKQAYVHAFVALAAASAVIASRSRADELCSAVTAVVEQHFWLADEGVMAPSFSADWRDGENYRGANANMHTIEAFLALADATGNDLWLDRALGLAKLFGHDIARTHDYRLPEHFDADWHMLPDYNADKPTDDLRPWGMTPGHFAEWGGLMLKVEAALHERDRVAPDWLYEDAIGLFDSAMAHGWHIDGAPGMVYTIGWDNAISVANRPWWVQVETANTAYMLLRRTGEQRFESAYRMIWDYTARLFIDRNAGGWRPEIGRDGTRTQQVYPLREDLYHAFQATVTPLLPLSASLAGSAERYPL
ncbi:MAG: AGE family epimerase/isomerase [Paraglaciecola chathamensis]